MMKKNTKIGIIIAILLVIAAITSWYFLVYSKQDSADITVTTKDIQKHLPDMTKEEIDSVLNTELAEEQLEAYRKFEEENFLPEVEEEIEDDDPDDNIHTYIGKDGNIYELVFDDEAIQNDAKDPAELKEGLLGGLDDVIAGKKDLLDVLDNAGTTNSDTQSESQEYPSDDGSDEEEEYEYEDYPFDEISYESEEPDNFGTIKNLTPNTEGSGE